MWNCNNPYAYRDENLARLGFKSYQEYLKSDLWKWIKERALKRAGRRCERCASTNYLQVHHRAYDSATLCGKSIDSLTVVCRSCHCRAERPDDFSRSRYDRLHGASAVVMEDKPDTEERIERWYAKFQGYLKPCPTRSDKIALILLYRDRATRPASTREHCLLCGALAREAREPHRLSTGYVFCREHSWMAIRAAQSALKLPLPDSIALHYASAHNPE